jgi:hypothetical protein
MKSESYLVSKLRIGGGVYGNKKHIEKYKYKR